MRLKALIPVMLLLAAGCGKLPAEGKYSWELYRAPSITAGSFHGAAMAILPAAAIQDDPNQLIYREALAGLLYNSLAKLRVGPKIISVDEVQSGINRAALWDEYLTMLREYEKTAVLRKDILSKLGKALGTRYVLLPKLLRFQQITFDRAVILGISFLKTRESSVDIHAQIWDTETGAVIWQGAGEGVMATEVVRGKPVSFMAVAQQACESLTMLLPWTNEGVSH